MTDKVNIEIPAEVEGILTHQFAKEGDVVPVGTRIATIDDGSAAKTEAAPATETKTAAPATAAPATPAAPAKPAKPAAAVKATGPVDRAKMSPKVKMLIRDYSLDQSTLVPTGKSGRLTVEDVMRAVDERSAQAGFTAGPIPTPPVAAMPAPTGGAPAPVVAPAPVAPKVKVEIPRFESLPESQRETRVPLQGIRKVISDHMLNSVRTSPHVTTFEDLDLTELVSYRNSIKADFRATYGANITYMPFIVKAVCVGLREFPKINASMTEKEIIFKNFINIGIAVAREEGLIVPVIRDADKKTIIEMAVEIGQIGEKARTNRLVPDDVANGTFSITNAGMFGATSSTPIINQPEVAILGVHAIVKKPWVVNGEIQIRDISTFGMSFDHRLIDGHTAVQFLHRVHEYLADPKKLLLQLR